MIGSVADGSLFLDVIYPNLMKNKLLLSLRIQRNKLIHTSEQTQIGNHYSLNIFSEIPFYELSLYIRYLQMFSFDLNTHEISLF